MNKQNVECPYHGTLFGTEGNEVTPAGCLGWLEHCPVHQKAAGSILGQGTYLLRCGFHPWSGHIQEVTNQCFSLTSMFLPLSLTSIIVLAGAAQWVEIQPVNQKVAGAHAWVAGQVPSWGCARVASQPVDVSLPHQCFSPLSPSLPLSLKSK